MKIVNSGGKYKVYGSELVIHDELPVGIYNVGFNPMGGFYLEGHSNVEVKESNIYGDHEAKLDKVLSTFDRFERNLGLILSGDKGMGKSLFAKMLAIKAMESGKAVILVDQFISGISSFLESIEQEVVVIFDEFDKTFRSLGQDAPNPQDELLTLIDGFGTGKKMFVITCNEVSRLNDYFVNRTGRFHFHIRFDYPTASEIEVYLKKELNSEFYGEISPIINFSLKVDLNYDNLRAIAFEVNSGETFKNAIKYLNIMNVTREDYLVTAYSKDDTELGNRKSRLDLFSEKEEVHIEIENQDAIIRFKSSDIKQDLTSGDMFIVGSDLNIDNDPYDNFKEAGEEAPEINISVLVIRKEAKNNLRYSIK